MYFLSKYIENCNNMFIMIRKLFIGCISDRCVVLLTTVFVVIIYSFIWMNKFYSQCRKDRPITNYFLITAVSNPEFESFKDTFPPDDEFTLIDIQDFKFVINNSVCDVKKPLLLTMIITAPNHFERRQLIRETWAVKQESVAFLFVLGFSKEYDAVIKKEENTYGDLLQGSFIDTYYNLTYKHVMMLKWAAYYCKDVKYVLKVDDDVFVNVPAVLQFIKYTLSSFGARRLMLCEIQHHPPVVRSPLSKWKVSKKEYPEDWYPNFCSGWSVMYSTDTMITLYREAQREPYFRLEDVHVTGILAKKENLVQTSISNLVLSFKEMEDLFNNGIHKRNFLFGPPHISDKEIKALYNIMNKN